MKLEENQPIHGLGNQDLQLPPSFFNAQSIYRSFVNPSNELGRGSTLDHGSNTPGRISDFLRLALFYIPGAIHPG